ncbi:hypothetical protein [Micromonospora sp. NPDC049891]|uniref:hypothetical protein n=1 Tax=Micromonospora sp. NPDC049891 TaxID=3155655 RepID=UPI00340FFD88
MSSSVAAAVTIGFQAALGYVDGRLAGTVPGGPLSSATREEDQHLVDTVTSALTIGHKDGLYRVACEAASTRSTVRHLRRGLGGGKEQVASLAYRRAR